MTNSVGIYVIAPTLLPSQGDLSQNPLAHKWLKHAVNSHTLLLATSAHCSVHLDSMYGYASASSLTLQLKAHAVHSLNHSLSSETGVNDIAIGAVTVLTANCLIAGDADELQMHLSGLKQMVDVRGGFAQLGLDGSLQTGLSCIDTSCAILTGTAPIFQSSTNTADFQLQEIFSQLRHLTRAQSSPTGDVNTDLQTMSRLRAVVETKFLATQKSSVASAAYQLVAACCTAALIYTHFVLRTYDPQRPVLSSLLRGLRQLLTSVPAAMSTVRDERRLLLWALCVGYAASKAGEQKVWFMESARGLARALGIKEQKDLKGYLARYVWNDRLNLQQVQ